MRIILNGYPVDMSVQTAARTVEAYAYFSAIFGRALTAIQALLHEHGIRAVAVQTSPFVFYQMMKGFGVAEEGRVVVDIGGEITEVTLMYITHWNQ